MSYYIFSGDYVYTLDNLRIRPGYPRLIRDVFPYAAHGIISAALYWENTGETWLFQVGFNGYIIFQSYIYLINIWLERIIALMNLFIVTSQTKITTCVRDS